MLSAVANAPNPTPVEIWNEFAATSREWANLYNMRQPGTINARELQLWNRMKKQWPEVRKAMDSTY
jgi:hypothetical protein